MTDYRQMQELIERFDQAIANLEDSVLDQVNASLDASLREIERELRRLYPQLKDEGSMVAFALQTQRYQQLQALLGGVLPFGQQAQMEELLTEALRMSGEAGQRLARDLTTYIDPEYPLGVGIEIPIEAVIAQARDGVRWLYRYADDFARNASQIIQIGLMRGDTVSRVARNLRNRLGVAKSHAETIVRTKVMSVYNTAADAEYEAAGIDFVQVQVTPSEALCRYCLARNMRVYKRREISLPFHPRCRCIAMPWLEKWQKAGLTDDDFAAEFRQEVAKRAAEQGIKPDYGPTYWEREQQGLSAAPQAVWSP